MPGFIDDIKNEFAKTNNVVVKLILINVIIFLMALVVELFFHFAQQGALYHNAAAYLKLSADLSVTLVRPWTIITNFFIHDGIWHILFNMLFLYWFGGLVEEYLGSKRLLSLYILGGLAGGIFFLLMYNILPYFAASVTNSMLMGASGAIFAIIVGAATLLPDYTFFIFLLGPVRIKYIAAFYVVLSMIELMGANAGGNLAHLAGAGVGYGFIKSLRAGTDWGAPVVAILDFFQGLLKPKSSPPRLPERAKATTTASMRKLSRSEMSSNATTPPGFPMQEEVDALLDKISKSGYDSLTREEKQILYKASQQE
jgi:membrane associated rhomboid family serine protease